MNIILFFYYKRYSISANLSNAIHVWHTKLDDHIKKYKFFQNLLSVEETVRAGKLKPPHRYRFTLTRGILRHLLSKYMGEKPCNIHFSYTKFGKPYISAPLNQIQFNLSHSHNRAVFALTLNTPVGIDLEYKVTKKYIDKIAYRFLSSRDYEQLMGLTGKKKLNAFFNAWVRNEALLKVLGCPLKTHPASKHQTHNKEEKNISYKRNSCFIITLTLHPDFATALAMDSGSKIITIKKYD